MAKITWTVPALNDLDEIADHIAIDNPTAARELVKRVFDHIDQLTQHPKSGSKPLELGRKSRYRQIVEPPCRIFYRQAGKSIFIVHVMRSERKLRRTKLRRE